MLKPKDSSKGVGSAKSDILWKLQLLSHIKEAHYHWASRLSDQNERGLQLKWLKCFVKMEGKCLTMQTMLVNVYIWGSNNQSIMWNRPPTCLPLRYLSWIYFISTIDYIFRYSGMAICISLPWLKCLVEEKCMCLQTLHTLVLFFPWQAVATLPCSSRNMVAPGSRLHAALILHAISLPPHASILIIFPSSRRKRKRRRRERKRRWNKTKLSLILPFSSEVNAPTWMQGPCCSCSCSILVLEQCLAHGHCPINICQMNDRSHIVSNLTVACMEAVC